MKSRIVWPYWLVLGIFCILAIALSFVSAFIDLPSRAHDLTQSVAEALIVAVVVSLAVEPRLLRQFGEELASQTFWTSFYSRAPEEYREGIKELASATQFTVAIHWHWTLDWADDDKTIIKLSAESVNHRENRGSKPFPLNPRTFVYEPPFPSLEAEIVSYSVVCQGAAFYANPIKDGLAKTERGKDGRLMIVPSVDQATAGFRVPTGLRYTFFTKAVTYVPSVGHYPFFITTPALSLTVSLSGNALPDLYLSILHPGLDAVMSHIEGTGPDLQAMGSIQVSEVSMTGQAILFSWAKQVP